ncbi:protein NO VEIN domain-containing protein [Burkholderia cepacia]|uniref:protein NO VEIN domain-containing protein n=1 Tax=Burkholderia cepacia TaxID=292 RepID=UPI002AB6AF23|nr:DUF3883 domain-containing protein [Burkholderia cepacia]
MKKVLWVKFGWSEYYRGGLVDGNFAWLVENGEKNGNRGHEAFNFKLFPDGTYYCYVPPQGKGYAPSSEDPTGWTVICLAKNPKHSGIHVVGWYENATLHGGWFDSPNAYVKKRGDTDRAGYDWSYCITSKTAYFVPPAFRTLPFSDASVRQAKYSYLEGPGVKVDESKKRILKLLEDRVKAMRPFAVKNPSEEKLPDPELDATDPLRGFGTPEDRKRVEKAAELAVIEYFKNDGFDYERVTHLPCGFDFVFSKGKTTLNVEVKGTSGVTPQFFLTRNEHEKGLSENPFWRLAMVTSALDEPKICVYNSKQLKEAFDLDPYVYIGRFIPKSDSD